MRTLKDKEINEALDILQEECAEVIQVASKIKRFGIDDTNPADKVTNRENLGKEMADLMAMMVIISGIYELDEDKLFRGINNKLTKLKEWSNIPHDVLDAMMEINTEQ